MARSILPSVQTFPRLSGTEHGVIRRGAGDEQAERDDGNKRRARAANDGKEMAASHHSLPSAKKVIVPFLHKSDYKKEERVVSFTHEENIIYSQNTVGRHCA